MIKRLVILVTLILTLVLIGCTNKDYYHPSYGFRGQNPDVFNHQQGMCTQSAYNQYPYIQPPTHPGYNHPACNNSGYGNPMACGNYMHDVDRQYEMALDNYKRINKARESYVDNCMSQQGWYVKEIPEQ